MKFTNNGLIAVTAEVEEQEGRDWLVIAISDTGPGIAAEDLPRVFMPFTQIDSTATRSKGGMGLGLLIAQRIAHALGGEVTAASEVGAGSTFTVRTPLRLATPAASERAAA